MMFAFYSDRAAQIRRDTWRRRHDCRNAAYGTSLIKVVRPPAQLAKLLVSLSRGNIGPDVAHDIVAIAKGDTTVEIVIDLETGLVAHCALMTGDVVRDETAKADPTALTPAA